MKENEGAKVRAVQSISYAAAVNGLTVCLNGSPEEFMVVDSLSLKAAGASFHEEDPDILKVKKVAFYSYSD